MKIEFSINLGRKNKQPKVKPKVLKKSSLSFRNNLIIAVIYLVLLVVLVAIGSMPSIHLAKPYIDNQNGFSIKPPKGWQIQKNQSDALVKFVDPKDSSKNININVSQTSSGLSDFVTQIKQALPQALPSFSILNEFDTTIGGQPTHVIDGEAQVNLVWKKDRVMISIKNSRAYTVAASTKLNDWDTNNFLLYSSLKSFQIK